MKILFVCHRFPYPPNRGGKIRPFQMIRHLARNHEVVMASLAHTREELQEGAGLKEYCAEVIAEVLPSPRRWLRAGAALATSLPSSAAYFRSGRLQERIRDAGHRYQFDVAMVHCAFVAHYALEVQAKRHHLDFGDLDSAKYFDYAQHRRFPLSAGYGYDARKLRRLEKRLAGQFDQCTVTTAGEHEEYRKLGVSTPCCVIPNGVDLAYFRPRQSLPDRSFEIIFLGRMDYYPNVDAITGFARECLPLIRKYVPKASLAIVGSNPTGQVKGLERFPGIRVTGKVPDVRPHLERAAVAVAPLKLARGTQNKILECMASGVPVVATTAASKGIQARAGEHLLVADTPEAFAAQVIAILQSRDLQARLAEAARKRVEEAHAWLPSLQTLETLLTQGHAALFPPREDALALQEGI